MTGRGHSEDDSSDTHPAVEQDVIPFREAVKAWFLISLQTFGGPAGQIAVMQRTLVDEKRWIGQQRFLHALNYCMLLPGPEAQQLAIYIGWLLNGVAAGWSPGPCSCCPAARVLVLSAVYVGFGDTTAGHRALRRPRPCGLAIVVQAVVRVGRSAWATPPWSPWPSPRSSP